MIDLATRRPNVSPQELTQHLTPSKRFAHVSFAGYQPNPDFGSQAEAVEKLQAFLRPQPPKKEGWWPFQRAVRPEGRGLYLDGGFGVGKTHLLASTYHAAQGRRALMSFQDLMYLIGALGMAEATAAFADHDLLLIDEFELDDPGNTHMANTFLEALMPAGVDVVATSNTAPGALGEGRFNARDFERQIKGIADRFVTHRVDGPDYRHRSSVPAQTLSEAEFAAWQARQDQDTLTLTTPAQLDQNLLAVHPSRFAQMLSGVEAVGILNLSPIAEQGAALRLVHFVDKVYDLGLRAAATGAPLETLFDESYRHGAFAKKYSRCLSRLSELLSEAREELGSAAPESL